MKDLNLIRKIAWGFSKTTGQEFDELFGEASLAYVEALQNYDPAQAQLSTWATIIITHHLKNFCKRERLQKQILNTIEKEDTFSIPENQETEYLFKEWMCGLPQDLSYICKMIFETPEDFLAASAKASRGKLIERLRKQEWSWKRIWDGIRNIKSALNEIG